MRLLTDDPGTIVDVLWDTRGTPPAETYQLFAALSKQAPHLHDEAWLRIHPVAPDGGVGVRVPKARLPLLRDLGGCTLHFGASSLVLSQVPSIVPLSPARTLSALICPTYLTHQRGKLSVPQCAAMVQERLPAVLARFGIYGRVEVDARAVASPQVGRQAKRDVALPVTIRDLRDEQASLLLQANPIGGRARMGCGLFVSPGGPPSRIGTSPLRGIPAGPPPRVGTFPLRGMPAGPCSRVGTGSPSRPAGPVASSLLVSSRDVHALLAAAERRSAAAPGPVRARIFELVQALKRAVVVEDRPQIARLDQALTDLLFDLGACDGR